MAGGNPQGAVGGPGPKQKCTVMVKVPPGPGDGAGQSFLEKNGDTRRPQAARRAAPRALSGAGGCCRRLRSKSVGSGMWGWEAAAPAPAVCLPQPKYQLAEEEES